MRKKEKLLLEQKKKILPQIQQKLKTRQTLTESELEVYYNTKYPFQQVQYYGRIIPGYDERVETDLRDFITADNFLVEELAEKIGLYDSKLSNDDKVQLCQKWIVDNFKYVYDHESTGYTEFWQFPYESIYLMTGDCEDGAILITSLLIAAGVPEWRLRVTAGLVSTNNPQAPTGGHGWCTYLREYDNSWCAIDWCYYPNLAPIHKKPSIKVDKNYMKVWFSFNSQYIWGDDSLTFDSLRTIKK